MKRKARIRRRALRALAIGLVFAAIAALAWTRYRAAMGDPLLALASRWHEGRRVVDRKGALLRELPSEAGLRGRSAPLEEIGDRLVTATLVSEDKDFYVHDGTDGAAILRAVAQNLLHVRLVSGASTITQQLVKLLDSEGRPHRRGVGEKLREAARAENLEASLDKRAILEAYLHRLSYGHGLTGPEAAAQGYFGKRARDLSWAEAAFLAVLPRAPSYLDPYAHPERVLLRQRALLDALRDEGVLGWAEHERAVAERVAPRSIDRPFFAPHLVDALQREGALADGPLTVATIDLDLQRDAEGLVRAHLASLRAEGAMNAAAIVVDNASGEALAYVGSADFDDASIAGQVDMVWAKRQPGSTLKPFVYALAFGRGRTAADMLADVPTSFIEARGSYAPDNFDGTFLGPISAREALAGSLNVPAIRLAAELDDGELLTTLRALGLESLTREASYYGLALALGSGEVRLRELAVAYMALARGGERVPLRLVAPEASALGRPAAGERVLDAGVAAMVSEILSDPLARVRGLHGHGPFDIGFPVAVKTGTSSGYRDTWTAGYTHERTVVVWVGNADGAPTRGLTGATGAGPLFADIMRRAMRDVGARAPLWDPALLITAEVCPLSGKRPGPRCSEHATRHFIRDHGPTEVCDVHVAATARPAPRAGEAPFRCDERGASTIVALPGVFDAWLAARPSGAPGEDSFGLPWFSVARVPGCNRSEGVTELVVEAPVPGSVFLLSQSGAARHQAVEARASLVGPDAARALGVVEFVLDGRVVASSPPPYRARIPLARGDHELEARPLDPAVHVPVRTTRFSVR